MKNAKNNYEAPVAEMIEIQASIVLMSSATPPDTPGFDPTGSGGTVDDGGDF